MTPVEVLAEVRRVLLEDGWLATQAPERRDPRWRWRDPRWRWEPKAPRSLAEAVEYVCPMDGKSWQLALVELCRRIGVEQLNGEAIDDPLLPMYDLESAIDDWEATKSFVQVLEVLPAEVPA